YIVRLKKDVKEILSKLDILKHSYTFVRTISSTYLTKTCCKKAYLRGAFLAGGSINNPETSSYHLEIFNNHEEHNHSLRSEDRRVGKECISSMESCPTK